MYEALESRRLMAVSASVSVYTLVVTGDASANIIRVRMTDATTIQVQDYVGGVGYQTRFSQKVTGNNLLKTVFVKAGAGNDTVTVDQNVVTLDTVIYGGAGRDTLQGGGGSNSLFGFGLANTNQPLQYDPAYDDGAADTLIAGGGVNYLYAQKGDDFLYAQKDSTTNNGTDIRLRGGEGNDTLILNGWGAGICRADGGEGNDTIKVLPGTQRTESNGNEGYDTVDYSGFGQAAYIVNDAVGSASGSRSNPALRHHVNGISNELYKGTPYDDFFINVLYNKVAMYGYKGNDLIVGGPGNDLILGGEGNDDLEGSGGDDYIAGEAGNDYLVGGGGNDKLYGGDNTDRIYGGVGNDFASGGNGTDSIYGQSGNDYLYGGSGNDLLVGGTGADFFDSHDGTVGNDIIYGDNQNGTGGLAGELDIAYIDRTSAASTDKLFGVEAFSA